MKSVFVALWLILTWLSGSVRATQCCWFSDKLSKAAQSDDWSSVRVALENKYLIADARTPFGDSWALAHYAATKDTYGSMQLLADNQADLNIRDLRDMTPLHVAAQLGKKDVVAFLLQDGRVNFNAQNEYNQTALHLAMINNYADVVKLLIRGGINVDLKDKLDKWNENGLPAIERVAPDNRAMREAYYEAIMERESHRVSSQGESAELTELCADQTAEDS